MKSLDEIRHLLDLPIKECIGQTNGDRIILNQDNLKYEKPCKLEDRIYPSLFKQEMFVGSKL